jgi:DNA-binding response OmpR family regulator
VPTALLCSQQNLEAELAGSALMGAGVERHFATKLEDARTMALAARPEIVVVDVTLPRADQLVKALRSDPSTRRISIAVVARGDFDPEEVALLEAGANAVLRLPPDSTWPERLQRLMAVAVRKAIRLPVSFSVEAHLRRSGVSTPGQAVNVSETGLLLESSLGLEIGDGIRLEFELPQAPGALEAHGRVVRRAGTNQYGIEFHDLDGKVQSAIHSFVDGAGD